jgi:hypothetical protein
MFAVCAASPLFVFMLLRMQRTTAGMPRSPLASMLSLMLMLSSFLRYIGRGVQRRLQPAARHAVALVGIHAWHRRARAGDTRTHRAIGRGRDSSARSRPSEGGDF